jgi:hypothetical protein
MFYSLDIVKAPIPKESDRKDAFVSHPPTGIGSTFAG